MTTEYLQANQPDILEVIANLSNDAVFTPPRVVNAVLNLLPEEVWTDPSLRWLDPGSKTGVFPREITKRLMLGLAEAIPDEAARLEHILTNMVFAIATEEITGMMSRRSLYCSKDASSQFSAVRLPSPNGNIWFDRAKHSFDKDRCSECGGTRDQLEQGNRANHAYGFIHADGRKMIEKEMTMKFDVIVGNPPYQMDDGGNKASSSPIYQLFVEQAKALNPQYVAMIIPSRWFAGGKGLDNFRTSMLKDRQITTLVDFTDASSLFPGIDIAGGVCYFLWTRGASGMCQITTEHNGKRSSSERRLDDHDTFIRFNEALPIIDKVRSKSKNFYDGVVSSRKPFGLDTTVTPDKKGGLTLYWRGGRGPIGRDRILTGIEMIDKWKVVTSRASYDHAGQHDKDGTRRVLSKLDILKPKEVCAETYLVLCAVDTKDEAESIEAYFRTRFARFMIAAISYTQDITKERFALVPVMPFTKTWTDEMLHEHFQLTDEEVSFISSIVKAMPA
jgi:site-specific DNA-methyltransferase (adenine-specific)